jgi:HPt (histidine-containing phosphotransfer) domain-containing protein
MEKARLAGPLPAILKRWLSDPASTQPATPAAPVDRQALDNIRALQREGTPNILSKAINRYLDYSPQLLQALRQATVQGDAPALQKAAHSLKSSSANLGALALAALCKDLEMMGRANTLENAVPVLCTIEAEYETVRITLAAEL